MSRIGWKRVVPLFVTVQLLNDDCVFNYQAICAYILTLRLRDTVNPTCTLSIIFHD